MMMSDGGEGVRDRIGWRCTVEIADYKAGVDPDDPDAEPVQVVRGENLLMHGGASLIFEALIGNGTSTPGSGLTFAGSATAAIGAGDSATAAAATQTDLLGTSRLRKGMDSGFPEHTDGTGVGARTAVWRATFSTSEANFDWRETGIFNSSSDGVGRMLNRIVQDAGVKTSAVSRVATITANLD